MRKLNQPCPGATDNHPLVQTIWLWIWVVTVSWSVLMYHDVRALLLGQFAVFVLLARSWRRIRLETLASVGVVL